MDNETKVARLFLSQSNINESDGYNTSRTTNLRAHSRAESVELTDERKDTIGYFTRGK